MRPDYAQLTDLPAPASSRLIGFERVEIVVLESFPPQFVLVVSGIKPWLNMEVTLDPLTYVRQPEYWGIEVVGRLPGGIGLPAVAPYKVSLPLAGIIGTKGIEVIGAARTERRDIGEEQPPQPAGTVFELRGADAELTYRATDAPQDRTLSFRDAEHDRSFSGAEIRTQQSELGEQVTVGLLDAPDAPLVKLTLLVPPVNLGQSSETVIETVAIISTHREAAFTPQPPEGQLTTYKSLCLTGTAQRDPVCPPAELTFSRDDRPVDGELRELKITPEDGSTFFATLRTAHVDRIKGQEVEQSEVLASGLTCSITDAKVTCIRDDRPVDGQLKELVVAQNEEGTFDATLRTAFFDRINGTEVDETADIGARLTKAMTSC